MGLLDGKVVVITGAGGGIGREHALAMAKEGAAIVVNDLGGARDGTGEGIAMADQVVDEIKALGAEAAANHDNVATVDGGEGILKTALDAFGKVDCVINNAGILRDKSFSNTTEDLWDSVIAVHLKGTYCVTRPIFKNPNPSSLILHSCLQSSRLRMCTLIKQVGRGKGAGNS